MTLPRAVSSGRDPLDTLRSYHALAPWGLRDLSALTGTLLEAAAVVPVNAAAGSRPSERTIRFYVAKGLVEAPDGRGTAAVYRYRHLLQILAIKLRQMEGASLEQVGHEFAELTGDAVERRVAASHGPGLPGPGELGPLGAGRGPRGRTARALRQTPDPVMALPVQGTRSVLVRRLAIAPGVELALDVTHPLFPQTASDDTVIRAVAEALRALGDQATGR